jgi:aspartate/methionine/tyrosine aminotransferase
MGISMKNIPINHQIVTEVINEVNIPDLGWATIREIVKIVNLIEERTGEKYIRMEMGVPGLKPPQIAIDAEISALQDGVASDYPMLDGIKPLKTEASRFIKNFIDIDLSPKGIIPTVGTMQAGYIAFMLVSNMHPAKNTILFIDPGFSVQKLQLQVMGYKHISFDVYNYRGKALREKLESYLRQGNINSIVYSNPNNPTWICLSDEELKIIGELANEYNVIVIEDLAYLAMDFRVDMSKPGVPPYQPSVAKYTDYYIMLISSSKVFSYAGQRIGLLCFSDDLYHRKYEGLKNRFGSDEVGYVAVQRIIYALSSGTSHSSQYAMAAMLKAANDGTYNFVHVVREYGEKAKLMKQIFTQNGFKIVYDKDLDKPLADGFYFTLSFPGMSGGELIRNLLYYGISAVAINICGSEHSEGLRACVSQVSLDQLPVLSERVNQFYQNYKI